MKTATEMLECQSLRSLQKELTGLRWSASIGCSRT